MRRGLSRFLVPAVALAGALGSGAWLVTQEMPAWASAAPWDTYSAQAGTDWSGTNWSGTNPGMMTGTGMGMMGSTGRGMMTGTGMGMMGSTGRGMMGSAGRGMMGWAGGNAGPVADLDGAREQATGFARFLGAGLRVGEIMRFSNHYYAQILDSQGSRATEVLVDPDTGDVQVEFGPAMMWNTRYGMAAARSGTPAVSPDEARAVAERALGGEGTTVGSAEEFPGHYTLHILRDGEVDGMASVNTTTGAVWYHSWHDRFVEMSEDG